MRSHSPLPSWKLKTDNHWTACNPWDLNEITSLVFTCSPINENDTHRFPAQSWRGPGSPWTVCSGAALLHHWGTSTSCISGTGSAHTGTWHQWLSPVTSRHQCPQLKQTVCSTKFKVNSVERHLKKSKVLCSFWEQKLNHRNAKYFHINLKPHNSNDSKRCFKFCEQENTHERWLWVCRRL